MTDPFDDHGDDPFEEKQEERYKSLDVDHAVDTRPDPAMDIDMGPGVNATVAKWLVVAYVIQVAAIAVVALVGMALDFLILFLRIDPQTGGMMVKFGVAEYRGGLAGAVVFLAGFAIWRMSKVDLKYKK